ncbi:MAG: glutamate--tRNA ligase, partial [Candidatus Nealsonbacteria bacterium]|nr:glutamate--tRNA ligase [Candidatus Nealsonbacteria bacterium]
PYLVEAGLIEPDLDDPNSFLIKATGERANLEYLKKIVAYQQPRLKRLGEIVDLADYFFAGKVNLEIGLLKWKDATPQDIKSSLDELINLVSKIEEGEWGREKIEQAILPAAETFSKRINKAGLDRGYLLWPMRAALSGKKMSLGPFEIADVLGKEKTLLRLSDASKLV